MIKPLPHHLASSQAAPCRCSHLARQLLQRLLPLLPPHFGQELPQPLQGAAVRLGLFKSWHEDDKGEHTEARRGGSLYSYS